MMYRELNSRMEMLRRLVYLVYVLTLLAFPISLLVAFARRGWLDALGALTMFALLVSVRYVGYCWLDFRRLYESFPAGCARDAVPEPIRTEVECLVEEFHAPGTDWVRRSRIRRWLIELEEQQPEIIEAYQEDLRRVLAA